MPQIAAVRTTSNATAVALALADAWFAEFGSDIPPAVLRLIVALSDLETRTWQAMYHHNPGNLTATAKMRARPDSRFFVLEGDEGGDSGSDAEEHFYQAFASLAAGARAQVRQLMSDTRPEWRQGLLTGHPETFVMHLGGLVLGGPKYFEADPEGYARTFRGRWERYAHLDPKATAGQCPAGPVGPAGQPGQPWPSSSDSSSSRDSEPPSTRSTGGGGAND